MVGWRRVSQAESPGNAALQGGPRWEAERSGLGVPVMTLQEAPGAVLSVAGAVLGKPGGPELSGAALRV